MKRQTIIDKYCGAQESLIFLEPEEMDAALVGVVQGPNGLFAACYSEPKIIKMLMDQDNISFEEALEFYNFNILGSYMGESTPVFLDDEE